MGFAARLDSLHSVLTHWIIAPNAMDVNGLHDGEIPLILDVAKQARSSASLVTLRLLLRLAADPAIPCEAGWHTLLLHAQCMNASPSVTVQLLQDDPSMLHRIVWISSR